MSVNFISSPNPLAATFSLGDDYISGIGKIMVPRNDVVAQHAPIIDYFLKSIGMLNRVDLVHSDSEGTLLTVNLSSAQRKVQPNFKWDDNSKGKIVEFTQNFMNQGGKVMLPSLGEFEKTNPLTPETEDDKFLFETFDKIAKPMAHKDGGDYEAITFQGSRWGFSRNKKEQVTAIITTFGNCAGCSGFQDTYGQSPEHVNKELHAADSPYLMKDVQEAKNKGALIFPRRP